MLRNSISKILFSLIICLLVSSSLGAKEKNAKRVALGDVETGHVTGAKPADIKETIQISMKKELEKRGDYNVFIASPAVVTGTNSEETEFPSLPTNRAPTAKEMAKYMAALQQMQKEMTGQIKKHKPVSADAYFDFRLMTGKSGVDTGGVASTISQFTGLDTSAGDISTKSTSVHLVCSMRNPQTGNIMDQYTAKVTNVRFRNLGGMTSYNYGSDSIKRERLFKRAVSKCAKWMDKKLGS